MEDPGSESSAPATAASDTEQIAIDGAEFTKSVEIGGEAVPLRGAGTIRFLGFKVYSAALYADAASPGKLPDAKPAELAFVYHRTIDKKHTVKCTEEHVEKNPDADLSSLRVRLDRLYEAYATLRKGDSIRYVYDPEKGTEILINGRRVALIEGEDFAQAIFGCWLSDQPVDEALKKELLGNGNEKE